MISLPRLSILLAIASGCGSNKSGSGTDTAHAGADSPTDNPDNPGDPGDPGDAPTETADSEPLFEVTGGPYDLALASDGRLFISIEESRIDVWDPEEEWVEEYSDRTGSIFGLTWHEENLYYTTSNHDYLCMAFHA